MQRQETLDCMKGCCFSRHKALKEGQIIKGFFDKLGHLDFIVQAFEGFFS